MSNGLVIQSTGRLAATPHQGGTVADRKQEVRQSHKRYLGKLGNRPVRYVGKRTNWRRVETEPELKTAGVDESQVQSAAGEERPGSDTPNHTKTWDKTHMTDRNNRGGETENKREKRGERPTHDKFRHE